MLTLIAHLSRLRYTDVPHRQQRQMPPPAALHTYRRRYGHPFYLRPLPLPPAAAAPPLPDENRGFDVLGRAGVDLEASDDDDDAADDDDALAAAPERGATAAGALASARECSVDMSSRMRRESS